MLPLRTGAMAAVRVSPAPTDGVTKVAFSPCGDSLLVASWSGELALHAPTHGALTASATLPCPALSAAYTPDTVYAGGLDGRLYAAAASGAALAAPAPLPAAHAAAVSSLAVLPDGALASGSWDGLVRLHDARVGGGAEDEGVATDVRAGAKVYALDAVGSHGLAVVTSAKRVRVVDRRRPGEFVHDIAPALNAPLRVVSASPRRPVLVLGTTDGRVAVESLDGGESPSFAFKCHRADGRAYPVNAIAHNRRYGSFVTGGGDGGTSVWDGVAKKRIFQYPLEETSVSSIAFSPDDARMAVAVSYTFEDGERDTAPDTVLIRPVLDAEIRTRDAGVLGEPSVATTTAD